MNKIILCLLLSISCFAGKGSGSKKISISVSVSGSIETKSNTTIVLSVIIKNTTNHTLSYIEMDSSWFRSFQVDNNQFKIVRTGAYGEYGDFPRIVKIPPHSIHEKIFSIKTRVIKSQLLNTAIQIGFNFHEIESSFSLPRPRKLFKQTDIYSELYDMKNMVWSPPLILNFKWDTQMKDNK